MFFCRARIEDPRGAHLQSCYGSRTLVANNWPLVIDVVFRTLYSNHLLALSLPNKTYHLANSLLPCINTYIPKNLIRLRSNIGTWHIQLAYLPSSLLHNLTCSPLRRSPLLADPGGGHLGPRHPQRPKVDCSIPKPSISNGVNFLKLWMIFTDGLQMLIFYRCTYTVQ